MENAVPLGVHRNRFLTHYYLSVILAFIGLSILCQAIAFAMPGWLIVDMTVPPVFEFIMSVFSQTKDITQNYGVWYVQECHTPHPKRVYELREKCVTRSYMARHQDQQSYKNAKLQGPPLDYSLWLTYPALILWQIQVTLALVSAFLAAYFVYMQRLRVSLLNQNVSTELPTKCKFAVALIFTLISCANIFMPVCQLTLLSLRLNEMSANQTAEARVPYGVVVEAIAVVFLFIAALLLVTTVWKGDFSQNPARETSVQGQQMIPLVVALPPAEEQQFDNTHLPMQGVTDMDHDNRAPDSRDDPPPYDDCVQDDQSKHVFIVKSD